MGLLTAGVALVNLRDARMARRYNNAAFWGLYSITFFAGSYLPNLANGTLLVLMVLVASVGKLGKPPGESVPLAEREASARRWGNMLFIPALTIPAITLLGTLTLKTATFHGAPLVDPKQVTLISLAIATIVALVVGMLMLRPPALAPIREARRLMDTVGWAAVLPQTLAALGAVFATAGVGQIVTSIAQRWIPLNSPIAAVATYTVGMAIFPFIMDNAFAAVRLVTAGIGLPLIVQRFGGNVVIMAAVGMVSGFCGTLMTPMAANFNVVPAALLELPSEHAVIKIQIPTGVLLLIANTAIMYLTVFRF